MFNSGEYCGNAKSREERSHAHFEESWKKQIFMMYTSPAPWRALGQDWELEPVAPKMLSVTGDRDTWSHHQNPLKNDLRPHRVLGICQKTCCLWGNRASGPEQGCTFQWAQKLSPEIVGFLKVLQLYLVTIQAAPSQWKHVSLRLEVSWGQGLCFIHPGNCSSEKSHAPSWRSDSIWWTVHITCNRAESQSVVLANLEPSLLRSHN